MSWSELLPSWPDDVELAGERPAFAAAEPGDGGGPSGRPVVTESSTAPIDPSAWAAARPPWRVPRAGSVSSPPGGGVAPAVRAVPGDPSPTASPDADPYPDEPDDPPSAGAFGARRGRFSAFDPGRRGVKALAAVAAAVVLIAAFLAWRARPQVEQAPPPPAVAEAPLEPADPPPPTASAGAQVVVAVEGKVGKPGVVRLPAGARVADALAAAGGAQTGVDVALLNLARKVVDGELILVGVTPPPGTTVPAAAPGGAPAGPVNLNTATVADLDTLPGVGPVLAQRILDARTAQGGFRAVTDLRQVEGIGASRFEQLKDLVTV